MNKGRVFVRMSRAEDPLGEICGSISAMSDVQNTSVASARKARQMETHSKLISFDTSFICQDRDAELCHRSD